MVSTSPSIRGRGPRNEPASPISPHEAGRYGRIRVETPKTIDQLRQLIKGRMTCPFFAGSKTSELSINNSTMMLQDKIPWTLNTHELEELHLPRGGQDARGFHIRSDSHIFRRRKLRIGLIYGNLLTHYQLTSSEPVTVVTLTGETAVLNLEHVTLPY